MPSFRFFAGFEADGQAPQVARESSPPRRGPMPEPGTLVLGKYDALGLRLTVSDRVGLDSDYLVQVAAAVSAR